MALHTLLLTIFKKVRNRKNWKKKKVHISFTDCSEQAVGVRNSPLADSGERDFGFSKVRRTSLGCPSI